MEKPLEYLKSKITEIEQQYEVCVANNCDSDAVRLYLLEFKYAYKLLKDFGFLPKKGPVKKAKKLTYVDVKNIRKYYNPDANKYSSYSAYGLAYEYDVHYTTIMKIVKYTTWKQAS